MRLILASGSPRRRELIARLGIPFEVIKSNIDETRHPDESPIAYVERLSIEKAQAVASQLEPETTVLAADTVVVLGADTIGIDAQGEILGKPADEKAARTTLERLRGQSHQVMTGVTLLRGEKQLTRRATTTVHMREYSDQEITDYIATGDPFDKAGGYAIQHAGFSPVERIDGDYNNVVGLPLALVKQMLDDLQGESPV